MAEPSDSYASALERLAQLQSNRAITSLFDRPPSSTPVDLNSLAIREMLAWLHRAGYTPQSLASSGLRCVHVAGTKGKAFARYVHEVWDRLTEAARREAREKKATVSEEELTGPARKPFYFRFLTLVAAHAFVSEGVTDAVVECGIGGEYDATSALLADKEQVTVAVVTQLGIDHVAMLGDTVEKIAWHKAGVVKQGRKGFTLRQPTEEAMEVLRKRAREKGAEELVVVSDDQVEDWEGVESARLQGPFQKRNMALAVAAAREHLLRTGVVLEGRFGTDEWKLGDMPEEFRRGLQEAGLRARGEVIVDEESGIEWHVDGAHTDDSLAGVGRWFKDRAGDGAVKVLLFNQQDRNPGPLLRALLGSGVKFDHAVFTRNDEASTGGDLSVQEALAETMKELEPQVTTAVYDAVQPAVEHIRRLAAQAKEDSKPCKVLATGSFHLAGPVLKAIGQDEP
ncbi:hypothetical protein VTJ49DRAFT_3947 [Mycothermus thermophilus]|uniref:tetrahydrofolate synthase n=1 Tax=Humicola insolens TaxID=85995 RepID=A0ABR3V6K2_HUMIN